MVANSLSAIQGSTGCRPADFGDTSARAELGSSVIMLTTFLDRQLLRPPEEFVEWFQSNRPGDPAAPTMPGNSRRHTHSSWRDHMRCRHSMPAKGLAREVLVDFDGTIARDDPTDNLFELFADPFWRTIEEAWQDGRISSRECMQRQVELLRVLPKALDEQIQRIRIDPGFAGFLQFCRRHGVDVKIVSDGFDCVVGAALATAGLAVAFFANKLEWQGGDRWRIGFPHACSSCRVEAANCKCSHAQSPYQQPWAVVGDGRSDFCMATRAKYVIAKGALADYCRRCRLPHATFTDFHDVTVTLSARLLLENWAVVPGSEPTNPRNQ
jgi:2-hydroxy-3-keto-5-methylthiopentenyl-1-phosphate phosphatase